ncbi:MAG: SIR2 family protein [Crocinitomix sp.]|nr:SIR2 family protein [Crocinitomix sp.]
MVKDKIPVELKNAIKNDDLVIFVGAGLSFNLVNSKNEPLKGWKNLVYNIIQNFQEKGYEVSHLKPLIELYEPIDVLNLIEKDKNLPKSEIYKYVKTFFELNEENNLELHKKLFKISKKIVTTNYDTAFEEAIPTFRRHKAYKGKNYELTTHRNKETPLLFKLHGCFEDAESMVLFPSNYKSLYENKERDAQQTLLVLNSLVLNKTVLFVGVGMGDFQINNIFKNVQFLQGEFNQKHFVVTNKQIDSTLNFVTTINYSQHSEIENLIDTLLEIKKQAEEESPEGMLRKQLEEAQKKLDEVSVEKYEEILSEKDRLLRRESIKHFMKGIEFSLSEEHQQAIEAYKCSVELNPYFHEAYNNWGVELANLADTKNGKESEELCHKSIEKFKNSIEINKNNHLAYNNWAVRLGKLAQQKERTDADNLYQEAFEKYQLAIDIKSDYNEALNNWGIALGFFAKNKRENQRVALLVNGIEKLQLAIKIKPHKSEAYNSIGVLVGDLAQIKKSDEIYIQAYEYLQIAIDIKPDMYEAFFNWGIFLGRQAKIKKGNASAQLYNEAFRKFKNVLDLKPNFQYALEQWGTFLGYFAKTKMGKESEDLFEQAFEMLKKAIELGGSSFNLSCIYAIKGERENAFFYLRKTLANKEISVFRVKKDPDWVSFLEDAEFKEILAIYKTRT